MNVFIKDKLDHAAILRSMGARPREVFLVYFMLAMVLGFLGSLAGVIPGALFAISLPSLAGSALGSDMIPVDLSIGFSISAVLQGVAAGMLATFLFTLLPVYRIQRVSPLRVLRKDLSDDSADPEPAGPLRAFFARLGIGRGSLIVGVLSFVILFLFILLVTATEPNAVSISFYFASAIMSAMFIINLTARLVIHLTRRFQPILGRTYALRQGMANLYRPGNQTLSVLTAIGVGFLLVTSIYIIENSIQSKIAVNNQGDLPNHFIIDVQPTQVKKVRGLLKEFGVTSINMAPMISARIQSINGRSVDVTNVEKDAVARPWNDRLRTREYFVTHRDRILESEELVAGTFWKGRPAAQEVSVDEDWARRMEVKLQDTLTLDVGGAAN